MCWTFYLIDLLGKMDATAVRLAAEQVFTQRATHKFPPTIEIPADWNPELEALANELGYPAATAAEIKGRDGYLLDEPYHKI